MVTKYCKDNLTENDDSFACKTCNETFMEKIDAIDHLIAHAKKDFGFTKVQCLILKQSVLPTFTNRGQTTISRILFI